MANKKHNTVSDYKYVTDLNEGDTLCRTTDDQLYTIRKIHEHTAASNKEKMFRIFEFDGFLVNQTVMRYMFKCEKFAENYYSGKKLITYAV